MAWTGFCLSDDHEGCPDSHRDTASCDCPCHLERTPATIWRGPRPARPM